MTSPSEDHEPAPPTIGADSNGPLPEQGQAGEAFDEHRETVTFQSQPDEVNASARADEIPTHLGRYEIHGLLGTGGFGQVYLGVDPQLGRKVAIKVPRHVQSAVQHEVFLREARRVAQLRHPSIVSVFDVGEFQGRCYIVSDYVEGPSLSDWMRATTYSWLEAVRIVRQLCDALAHAHEHSTVHRDIKPSNILIAADGRPVLLDFGLAVSDAEGRELPGTIAGTPRYMSPEQVLGKAHRIDGRTDIYSLGVLLYQLLTGRLPFDSRQIAELMRQICEDEPQPLRQLNPQLPPEIDDVCMRAMSKKAADRYRTAGDFSQALAEVLALYESQSDLATGPAPSASVAPSDTSRMGTGPSAQRSGSTTYRIAEAERRQVTALFVKLDDSLLTSGDLDPEEFRDIVQEVQQVCLGIVQAFSGHIAQSSTEGMLVYFGYPISLEDVLPQALRAGLAIVEKIDTLLDRLRRTYATLPEFSLGVHSGTVVAEESGSSESFSQYSIVGNVSKLADAVAGCADPGTVAVTHPVYQATRNRFEFRRLEAGLPGKAGVSGRDVYSVVREIPSVDRDLESRKQQSVLIGRDHEVRLLDERWAEVRREHGQTVLIGAEPGVGKSRLLSELRARLRDEAQRCEMTCSPHHQQTALHPLIESLTQRLEVSDAAEAPEKLAALEGLCDRLQLPRQETVPFLADLLSIPMGGRYRVFEGTPERRKQRTLEILLELHLLLCEQRPLLFVVEDLHWIDPTTQEFLNMLVDHVARVPCLLVLTFRPQYAVPWPMRPNLVQLMLCQLNADQTGALAASVVGDRKLSTEVLDLIVQKSDGVPLFVEEMTKALLESDVLELRDGAFRLRAPLESLSIPMTLQDSLMTRLDRLGGAKEIAQLSSILGREFSYPLIRAVAPLDEGALQQELTALVDAELLYQRGFFPRARFTFKHALVQDVAYDSLLRKTRRDWHGKVAGVLEAEFPQVVETEPAVLAHHFGEAGDSEQAANYWLKAGVQAQAKSALQEAIHHFREGLDHTSSIEDDAAREALEFQFQIPLGVALLAAQGYASPEVGPVFERANQLATRFGGVFERFHILWGTWAWRVVREELDLCMELARDAAALIQDEDDPGLRMESLFLPALTQFYRGEFLESRRASETGFALYDEERCRRHAGQTGQNSGATHQCYGALALWHLGFPDQALRTAQNAVAVAREVQHPFSLAYALHHLGWLQQHLRNMDEVIRCADEELALAEEHGFLFWIAEGHLCRGYGLYLKGQYDDAESEIRAGLQIFEMSGAALSLCHFNCMLAEINLARGNAEEALHWIERAIAASGRFGNAFHLSEIHRVKGDILLALVGTPAEQANSCYQQSLEIARRQQALSCELRAATSLARFRAPQGRDDEARAMLEAVCGRFSEGRDTPDFVDASTLLTQMADGR